uniref:Uncharacterized protein n=1 Tax=Anguilla anguilla TaxID=7936 RepID=A0A0E9XFH3_ANGAN
MFGTGGKEHLQRCSRGKKTPQDSL